jgi:hypothetical protein
LNLHCCTQKAPKQTPGKPSPAALLVSRHDPLKHSSTALAAGSAHMRFRLENSES